MNEINFFLEQAVGYVWGLPLVILLVATGITLTLRLKWIQWRGFRHAIAVVRGDFTNDKDPGEISHFQALTTALSATVGLGNIAGVAVAINHGGPGATLWMIIVGLLGMATKYAECSLSIMYRHVDDQGVVHGGPMHYITQGLGPRFKPLAWFFAFFCICGSFGSGNMFQTNQVASILNSEFQIPEYITGLVLAVAAGIVIVGGIKRIGKVTERLVPIMGLIYFAGAFLVTLINHRELPALVVQIFSDAFTGTAAIGGFSGVAVKEVIIQGVRRACFSNEAGMGSSPIAHSAASTSEPIREGVVALLEPFIDTVVICTLTALVILSSGAWTENLSGVELTALAFNRAIPGFGSYFVPVAVFLFAYSTLLSWSYYGERAVDFLWGERALTPYRLVFCVMAFVGAVWNLGPVISLSDITVGLMVVPNLIAVWWLMPRLIDETEKYFSKLETGHFVNSKTRSK